MIEFYELFDDENVPYRCDVDLDLIDTAPQEDKNWLLWLFIKTDVLDERLISFSNDLIETIEEYMEGVFAGRVIKEGWAEFCFSAPHSKRFENITSEVITRHDGYAYERGSS